MYIIVTKGSAGIEYVYMHRKFVIFWSRISLIIVLQKYEKVMTMVKKYFMLLLTYIGGKNL